MADQLITRTAMDDLRPLGGAGERSYEFVSRKMRESLEQRHANLFAEPVAAADGDKVDWMTPLLGSVRPMGSLPELEAEALRAQLGSLVRDIQGLIAELRTAGDHGSLRQAQALANALEIPRSDCIFQIGNQPVLVLWAHREDRYDAPADILNRMLGDEPRTASAAPAPAPPTPAPPPAPAARFRPDQAGIVIGRDSAPGTVVINHPAVSKRHAMYKVERGALVVRDLGSATGTFVNGVRVTGPTKVGPEDRVDIGPFRFDYDGETVDADNQAVNSGLALRHVSREVKIAGRAEPLRILDDVSLDISPGEFVCIIGPSGSGKSTLMNAMSGRVRPTNGQIQFDDFDLHAHFDLLKHSIAMVPQHNLLHETLTLRRALGYTAKLRLPADMSGGERRETIARAVGEVGLTERLGTRIHLLSGGQKKRCSLANELLDRPALLFLDEVTSGLDESTDMEIMALLRSMADQGMTIVCVTHTLANIEAFCDRVITMDVGGVLAFGGSPAETLRFFRVERLGEVFKRLPERPGAEWRAAYEQVAPALAQVRPEGSTRSPARERKGILKTVLQAVRQVGIMAHRNTALLVSDTRIWSMALVQSLLIGLLIGYAFSDFGPEATVVQSKISFLLLLGLAGLWIGCNSASKEIVGELAIYQRENDVNLLTFAFVTAKFLITGIFTVVQMGIVFALAWVVTQDIPGDPLLQFGFAALAAVAGCCLGLLISSIASTTEQATTIVPLMLVPQLILGGVIVPHLPEIADKISEFSITSNVLVESMKSVFIEIDGPIQTIDAETGLPTQLAARSYEVGLWIILAHCVIALSLSLYITYWRQARRRMSY